MKAELIAIGTELVSGQTVDTNSAWLSVELARLGHRVTKHHTVDDDLPAIRACVAEATASADVVIITGGLGPTADDLTREALADGKLELNAACLEQIRAFFRRLGREMSDSNQVQALMPSGAEPLANPLGTAPGIFLKRGASLVFALPGVPREMKAMFPEQVAPRLPAGGGVMLTHALHAFGAGESDIGARIADLMGRDANPLVGTTAAGGRISIRLITRAETERQADALAHGTMDEIRGRLGELVFGEGEDTLASVVGKLLKARGQTLATAESCTGGLIGQEITAVPGASSYYVGGVVAYANEAKTAALGVPEPLIAEHGAVSEPVAAAMAAGCRLRLGADWAVSVTGIAGPTGGTEEKPVGLVHIGVAGPGGAAAHRHVLPGSRELVRLRACRTALNLLRLALKHNS